MLGLLTRRRMPRNMIPNDYGLMTVDTDEDGVVDGFTKNESNAASVWEVDDGQKITLANVTNAAGFSRMYLTDKFAVSPSTPYALSVDASLERSGAEMVQLEIWWYTAADALITAADLPETNPGAGSRLRLKATSPATAAKAHFRARVNAKAIGATGVARFKNAIFQKAR